MQKLMKLKLYLILVPFLFGSCTSLEPIVYSFSEDVQQAIAEGVVDTISLDKKKDNTNIFAVFRGEIEIEIVLNSNVNMPDAIKDLINKTNRYIVLADTLKIPVLFMADISSEDSKLKRLPHLPFTGYTISLDRNKKLKNANVQF